MLDTVAGTNGGADNPIIGIDLGMTSIISAFVPGQNEPPRTLPAERGHANLPSVVAFKEGRAVVGRAALDMRTTAPTNTVTGIKRLLGRKARSQAVRDLAARVGFKIIETRSGEAAVEIEDRQIHVPEVAGILLDHMRRLAENHLGHPVKKCVIAVPAYFNDIQKNAVREAARLGGLEVKKLVHEPTAVALAYGYNKVGDSRIVIVDVGGVRLDVSVMEISGNVFDVVATGGDPYLGGANVDARVVEWILSNIRKKYGKDLRETPVLLTKVRTAAEQAKRELTNCRAVDIQIPLSVGTKQNKAKLGLLRLHLETLEELASDVVKRVLDTLRRTLAGRDLSASDIDDVILVGGATRMPTMRRAIERFFGQESRTSLPPEQVVSLGAALLADSLRRDRPLGIEVLDRAIGIALADGRYMRIIDKDSKLPITRRVMIPTVRDKQRTLEVDVYQGNDDDILDAAYVGSIVYRHIHEASAGEGKVIVDMTLESKRILKITSPEEGRDGETFELRLPESAEPSSPAAPFIVSDRAPASTT